MDKEVIEFLKTTNDISKLALIKQLDFLLDYFIEYPNNTGAIPSLEIIAQYIDSLSDNKFTAHSHKMMQDVLIILNQLIDDKYVKGNETKLPQYGIVIGVCYTITFKGRLFHQRGGYQTEMLEKSNEKTRVETLADNQKENANRMTYLTAILAFGTIALVLVECLKGNLNMHPDLKSCLILLFFGVGIGIIISLIIQAILRRESK